MHETAIQGHFGGAAMLINDCLNGNIPVVKHLLVANFPNLYTTIACIPLLQCDYSFTLCHTPELSSKCLRSHTVSAQLFPDSPRPMPCKSAQMGSCRITFLWLCPATDHEPHSWHMPTNKIPRRTEATPRSGWWRSTEVWRTDRQTDGINSERSTHEMKWKCLQQASVVGNKIGYAKTSGHIWIKQPEKDIGNLTDRLWTLASKRTKAWSCITLGWFTKSQNPTLPYLSE